MSDEQPERPIELTFPTDRVNEIAEREAHAKRYYRPVYTMHKWWARRLGSVFRTMVLYSLADRELSVTGTRQSTLGEDDGLPKIDWDDPEALWQYYLEDVDFDGKTVLDPFMGGGTSVVESLRLGCTAIGSELNPVAWFVVKKEVEPVDLDVLDAAFEQLEATVGREIRDYYRTDCPDCEDDHRAASMYQFWVNEVPCLECAEPVALFNDYRLAEARSAANDRDIVVCPGCRHVFETDDYRTETACPDCSWEFVPETAGTVDGGSYTCPHCEAGTGMSIVEAVDRYGAPERALYAVEYYCSESGEKGYKPASSFDRELFATAQAELAETRDSLPIPTTERYRGSSDRARKYGFERYDQMFNDRQLLCLGKLLAAIADLEDRNVREFLLLAFSDSLAFNNMFCEYHSSENKIQGLYKRHTITARHTPVENNVWGASEGAATFSTAFEKMRAGKEFCRNPYEKYVEDGETKQQNGVGEIEGRLVDDPADLGSEGNVFLRCGSSEQLPVADDSVDAVITDPPYLDNVMYAETADFYYVWLTQVLEDEYDQFAPERTPKASEVVSDPASADSVETYRDEEHFVAGLTSVFEEANRALKDDGVMAFTFHHTETAGWSTVLTAVLEAGFTVTAVHPIRGEMRGSTHIHNKDSIEYDVIVVCRSRREEPEAVRWETLLEEIHDRASEAIERLEADGPRLARGDVFAVAMGTCLEAFSEHYPNVTRDGQRVSVDDAIATIRDVVVERLLSERVRLLSEATEPTTAVYLATVLGRGGTIAADTLREDLRRRAVDVDDLVAEGLLERDGEQLLVVAPSDRVELIEEKDDPLAVDRAHYLFHLAETDRLVREFGPWTDDGAIAALEQLAEIENEDAYAEIADYVRDRSDTQRGLEEFG
ncbi:DUF1156 domain-containing protein [Natronococcus occultus]|uniref:Adenine-specific DNA methylase containing a Zn-ribbon n=1 Tax=Natronococcus occultus SP4 TaxID=694430 RepID=L0JXY6_9EURY|nr:DUF1156 domain-containing protein [Natronococcus occultus]AGB36718.1 adenine-specific DNA methylase containing a Zn-ribbon [Natronococcus occultus SP4]